MAQTTSITTTFDFFGFKDCHFAFDHYEDGSIKGYVESQKGANVHTFTQEGCPTNALCIKEDRASFLLMERLLDTILGSFAVPNKNGGYNLYLPINTGIYACAAN